MSTASRGMQLILLVDVTVPAEALPDSSRRLQDVDACGSEVYSQASGGRSLRGGIPAAM
ncbi:MAG TPA: hypothetical protein VJW94_15970 [Candidatus Acidoferrum sp.]|nr:hypothetical protein [Candidatus Acidoferrum sp.]